MLPKLHILVASDDYETREYLQNVLHNLGHDVGSVGTVPLLLNLCRTLEPDVVFAETRVGTPDASEAAVQVNREKALPFILIGDDDEGERLVRKGADCVVAYIAKPLNQAKVEEALLLAERWLRRLKDAREQA
jgi:AmiR/NasT family two-component response regulator